MIQREISGSVTILRLNHGKVNAIDSELLEAFSAELDSAAESSCRAFVLTGTGKTFSAGVDLFRLLEAGDDYLDRFLPLFGSVLEKFFLFPKPIVAAINGHAIAGGCVFSSACDYRIMSQGTIGIPELLVGVPFPPLALEVVRLSAAPQHFQEIVYTGRSYSVKDGLKRGLVDEVVTEESLLERSCEIAKQFAALPQEAFALTKRELRSAAVERAKNAGQDREILRLWRAPETHAIIRAYLQQTIGKKNRD